MKIADWTIKAREWEQKGRASLVNFFSREYTRRGLVIIFMGALFLGALTKSFFNDSLTMGYDDFKLSQDKNMIDLNVLQEEFIRSGGSLTMGESTIPQGESCSEQEE